MELCMRWFTLISLNHIKVAVRGSLLSSYLLFIFRVETTGVHIGIFFDTLADSGNPTLFSSVLKRVKWSYLFRQ